MTVTLHLKPEVEAGLLARAQASGVALEEYLLSLAEEAAFLPAFHRATLTPGGREEAVRRMLEFGEKPVSRSARRLPAISCMKGTATDGRVRPGRLGRNFMVLSGRFDRGYPLQPPYS